MPPTWLTIIAWISLAAGFWCAAAVLYDIYGRGLRQPMRVMEAVWPITALYLGPFGWSAYAGLGRPRLKRDEAQPEWEGYAIDAPEFDPATGVCAACGGRGRAAELEAYLQAPGTVVRCRSCKSVTMVFVTVRGVTCVDLRGLSGLTPVPA